MNFVLDFINITLRLKRRFLPAASDEFDGNELDSTKWNNGIWYDVTSDLAFSPSNVTVRDGNLAAVLTVKFVYGP